MLAFLIGFNIISVHPVSDNATAPVKNLATGQRSIIAIAYLGMS